MLIEGAWALLAKPQRKDAVRGQYSSNKRNMYVTAQNHARNSEAQRCKAFIEVSDSDIRYIFHTWSTTPVRPLQLYLHECALLPLMLILGASAIFKDSRVEESIARRSCPSAELYTIFCNWKPGIFRPTSSHEIQYVRLSLELFKPNLKPRGI